jgi:ankyrin repeat protein
MTALHHIASTSPRLPWTWKDVAAAAVPFCERGVSRSMRDRSGATPLIVAIKTLPEDGLPIVETLLMKSADERASWNCIGHEDHDRRDALYYAITMRRPLFVDVLLKNGAAVSFMDWVPIRGALNLSVDTDKQISKLIAQHEWSRRADILRSQHVGPEQNNQKSLFTEIFPTKDLAIMISMGLDPNALPKSSLGSSMLWAVLRQVPLQPSLPPAQLLDTIKVVLEQGADTNAGTERAIQRTPSPQLSSQDLSLSMHTLTFLLEECPTVDAELITFLVNKGTELSIASPFYDDRYPLHSAAKANRIDLVDKFLLQRADVDCADLEDRTPLFIAAKQGFSEIVNSLISRHANVNVQDKNGNTVLHMAACGGSKTVVAALLRAGAKANIKNTKNQTPLACVSENSQVKEKDEIVYMLKDAEQKEMVVEEQTRKMNAQSAAQEAKMKQQREQDEKNRQQRQREEQERKIKESEVSVQELSQVEAPPRVSPPTLKKRPSMLSKFRSSTFLAGRSKPQSPSSSVSVGMPKLEVSIRVTTPPASKHLDIASQNPAASITTPSIITAPQPPADVSKRAPNFRIDSGSWQKRASDAEKPLPVLDRTKAVLDGKTGDKRNSSAAELADWLALSKMMDGL